MSLEAVNRALRPHALLWRRLLLSLAAVGAILVGLLAMHSFSTDAGHGTTIAVAAEASHHADAAAQTVAHDNCSGSCEPGHSMAIMACLLALLVLTILFAVRDVPSRGLTMLAAVVRSAQRYAQAVPWPKPPSLVALSISRT